MHFLKLNLIEASTNFSGAMEEETEFGLEDIIPAVSRAAKNGRKKIRNEIELEKLKKRTTLKNLRYSSLDLTQVRYSPRSTDTCAKKILFNGHLCKGDLV